MTLKDLPAGMNRRYAIFMIERGLEPSHDASVALMKAESTGPYWTWIQRKKAEAEKLGNAGVHRDAIQDHDLFDQANLDRILAARKA